MVTYRKYGKSVLDVSLGIIAFVIFLPVLLVTSIVLAVSHKGTPFFIQTRPGKDEKLFRIIKFKTMSDWKNSGSEPLSNEERVTPLGKFVRRASIDEIPQLLNVIKGDMSLVGPRPLLPEYLPFYNDHHRRRHEVKPGITGLAQVSGRNHTKFSERFNLDVHYVDHLSFRLDCSILWLTVLKIFKTEDVVLSQTVDEVDDLGVSQNLPVHYFRKKE